jgi:L-asparaginase
VVDKGELVIRRTPLSREHLDTADLAEPVYLVKMAAGTDGLLIDACIDAGARGIVLEALGRGNVPPDCVPSIKRAMARGIPLVLTSRCLRGRVFESYGYEGGGKQLRNLGVIFADYMSGQKARIKLALALSLTTELAELRAIFESKTRQRS